ncbi:hypothetical protein HGG72_15560 [Ochrobactrum pecoris]|nr:hypothetical protein [Brucella pecoris]
MQLFRVLHLEGALFLPFTENAVISLATVDECLRFSGGMSLHLWVVSTVWKCFKKTQYSSQETEIFIFCFCNLQCKSGDAHSRCPVKIYALQAGIRGIHMTGVLRRRTWLLMATAALGLNATGAQGAGDVHLGTSGQVFDISGAGVARLSAHLVAFPVPSLSSVPIY